LSTPRRPKQFLALSSSRTILEETAARIQDPSRFKPALAIGAARHGPLLKSCLHDADILLEPVGRNSAPPLKPECC
jgi:mannose-1-phosphate guanylyltransferase